MEEEIEFENEEKENDEYGVVMPPMVDSFEEPNMEGGSILDVLDNDEVQVISGQDTWVPSRVNSLFNQFLEESKKTLGGSFTLDAPIVLITSTNLPPRALTQLRQRFRLLFVEKNDTQETVLQKVVGVSAIFLVGHNLKLDREMLDFIGKKLEVVGLMSSGYDHIDVRELAKRSIKIGNTASLQVDSVAEVAVALALSVAHRFNLAYNSVVKGKSVKREPDELLGKQLSSSVCGIIGFGDVGCAIAKRLAPFNIRQIMYSGHGKRRADKESTAIFIELKELLAQSDFVFIACPLTNETKHLINYATLKLMKPTCVLINVGRGGVIKTNDLVRALRERLIWGAGLDETDPQPLPPDHPLLHLPNSFITPGLGSGTIRTRDEMARATADNILTGLTGAPMPYSVCFKPDPEPVDWYKSTREPTRTPAKHLIHLPSLTSSHA